MHARINHLVISIFVLVISIISSSCGTSSNDDESTNNQGQLDNTSPLLTATSLNDNGGSVAPNASISLSFTEPVDASTVTSGGVTLSSSGVEIGATVSVSGSTVVITPISGFSSGATFTLTVSSSITDLAGNSLSNDSTYDFTTTSISDTIAPEVVATSPIDAAVGVALNATIMAAFSEPLNPATVTTTSFTVTAVGGPGMPAPIAGTVTYLGLSAVFTPSADLAPTSTYIATLTSSVADLAGNPLVSYTWSFSTSDVADTTNPTVISTNPATGDLDVAVNTTVSAVFSEDLDPATVTTATFTLSTGAGMFATNISGTVTLSGATATFTPDVVLDPLTAYTATLTTGITDLAGNALAANVSWSFATNAAALGDIIAPTVDSTDPAAGAIDVLIGATVNATFSESMDPVTINTTTFTLIIPGGMGFPPVTVTGTVAYDDATLTATFTPSADLVPDTNYAATITTGVTDLAGNSLAVNFPWTFTTGPAIPDTTAPTRVAFGPPENAIDVPINVGVGIEFNEPVDPATATTDSFLLVDETAGGTIVPGAVFVSPDGLSVIFAPDVDLSAATIVDLAPNTLYTITVPTGNPAVDAVITDLAGNAIDQTYSWSFTTGIDPDLTPPTVESTSPVDAETGIAITSDVRATFSEGMNPLTISTTTFTLRRAGGGGGPGGGGMGIVTGTVVYLGAIRTAIFTPNAPLSAGSTYTASISTNVTDFAFNNLVVPGNPAATSYSWTFNTAP